MLNIFLNFMYRDMKKETACHSDFDSESTEITHKIAGQARNDGIVRFVLLCVGANCVRPCKNIALALISRTYNVRPYLILIK